MSRDKMFVAKVTDVYRAPKDFPQDHRTLCLGNDEGAYLAIASLQTLDSLRKQIQEELEK